MNNDMKNQVKGNLNNRVVASVTRRYCAKFGVYTSLNDGKTYNADGDVVDLNALTVDDMLDTFDTSDLRGVLKSRAYRKTLQK